MAAELLISTPLSPEVMFHKPEEAEKIIVGVEKTVREQAEKLDTATETGRTGRKSLAFKVAKSKTALEDLRKRHTEELRKKVAEVNASGRQWTDRLQALQDEVKAPVEAFEAADLARRERHDTAIVEIGRLSILVLPNPSSESIRERLQALERYNARAWEEYEDRAMETIRQAAIVLQANLAAAEIREKEEAELRALREEKAARDAKDRAEQRAIELKAAQERAAAEARQEAEATAERLAAHTRRIAEEAQQEAERRVAEAERSRQEADRRAEVERAAAETRAQEAAAEAVWVERRRAERAEEARRTADAMRAADLEHRGKVNRRAMTALTEITIDPNWSRADLARAVIEAIAQGKIPHVTINY